MSPVFIVDSTNTTHFSQKLLPLHQERVSVGFVGAIDNKARTESAIIRDVTEKGFPVPDVTRSHSSYSQAPLVSAPYGPLPFPHSDVVPLYPPLLSVHLRFVSRRGSFHDHVIEVGLPHEIGKLLREFLLLFCALSCISSSNHSCIVVAIDPFAGFAPCSWTSS
jgi:hypothetical protein